MLWPDVLLMGLTGALLLVGVSLMRRLARVVTDMDRLRTDHHAMLVLFHEFIGDLDRAARQDSNVAAPVAPVTHELRHAVEQAIALAPEVRDPALLSRRTGVSLSVARAVIAFHGSGTAH